MKPNLLVPTRGAINPHRLHFISNNLGTRLLNIKKKGKDELTKAHKRTKAIRRLVASSFVHAKAQLCWAQSSG